MLDGYRTWRVRDEARRLVEADAGINLGADPSDPKGTATLDKSLLSQLYHQKQWTIEDTGGITHQTVSGFTATGSSGGSIKFSANNNLWGFRLIDGTGEVHEVTRDSDPDLLYSMSPNMGLLGVVSKITIECVPTFNIVGEEAVTTEADCPVDLYGEGDATRPSLEQFLRETDYARLNWWPQRGVERIVTWQAHQVAPEPGFKPKPYKQFTDHPEAAEHAISILYTVVGNLDDLSAAEEKLEPGFEELEKVLEMLADSKHLGEFGECLARVLARAAEGGVDLLIMLLKPFHGFIERELPDFFPKLLTLFVALDADKEGKDKGQPQRFQDYAWTGLPMDNEANDVLVPAEFTEMWIPLPRARDTMRVLKDYFTEPKDDHVAYERTGTFAWELYSAEPTEFWMAASHSTGDDEWKDGAFRVDPFWFGNNAGDPIEFYNQFWDLLRDAGIPFRLHWGKYQPRYDPGDRSWVDFFRAQYPRWDDFLRLREQRDPNNIFLTAYWRERFGLWDAPAPRPMP